MRILAETALGDDRIAIYLGSGRQVVVIAFIFQVLPNEINDSPLKIKIYTIDDDVQCLG